MLTARELQSVLKAQGLRLTRRLGQHHLIDRRIIERVVEACDVSRADTVVELGAGLGALTEPLAQRAGRVIAVEVDAGIARVLTQRLAGRPNVNVLQTDILTLAWERWPGTIVVGAIPYHITSPIVVSLCEHRAAIRRVILIVQEEVADRLAAVPGTKAYGRLSVLAQYGWQVETLLRVPRGAFFPQPQVDSACVRLVAWPRAAVAVEDEAWFFAIVRASFAHRRKTLANSLAHTQSLQIPRARVERALEMLKLSPTVRGEQLSLAQFGRLAGLLRKNGSI